MSVDMDIVSVMAVYLPVVRVCTAQSREALQIYPWCMCVLHSLEKHSSVPLDCAVHTRTTGKYAAITLTTSISTDMIEPLL